MMKLEVLDHKADEFLEPRVVPRVGPSTPRRALRCRQARRVAGFDFKIASAGARLERFVPQVLSRSRDSARPAQSQKSPQCRMGGDTTAIEMSRLPRGASDDPDSARSISSTSSRHWSSPSISE